MVSVRSERVTVDFSAESRSSHSLRNATMSTMYLVMRLQRDFSDVPELYTEISSAYWTRNTPVGGGGSFKR